MNDIIKSALGNTDLSESITDEEYKHWYINFCNSVEAKINTIEDHDKQVDLLIEFCDNLMDETTINFIYYGKGFDPSKDYKIESICKIISHLPKTKSYFWGIYYFFKGNHVKSLLCLKEHIYPLSKRNILLDESILVRCFLVVFLDAFPEFWEELANILPNINAIDGAKEFCHLVNDFYSCDDNDRKIELLQSFILKYPNYVTPKELLAILYYDAKLWNNAIAYFEQVEDKCLIHSLDYFYFLFSYAEGKIKNYKEQEHCLRKCLEFNPTYNDVLNNLGLSLFSQKKYLDASKIFQRCLIEKRDLKYAPSNYVMSLAKLGKIDEAKEFLSTTKFKIKSYATKLLEKNAKIHKGITDSNFAENIDSEEDVSIFQDKQSETIKTSKVEHKSKIDNSQQFASEKIFEDELITRLEKGGGLSIFGIDLKVYKRKGIYGRQYSFQGGRLDVLCEDNDENLYIIELKKDAGYSDVYKQISDYLDWFEKHKVKKGKKVYGIICLNDPDKALIDKVHKDSRMSLYNYQISYTKL